MQFGSSLLTALHPTKKRTKKKVYQ